MRKQPTLNSYQHKTESLTFDESDRFANAAKTPLEKIIAYTFLDCGLRPSELERLHKNQINWTDRQYGTITLYGKGGPYGKMSKKRKVLMSIRVRSILEHFFALQDTLGIGKRCIQYHVKRIGSRAGISKQVTPRVLRKTAAIKWKVQYGVSTGSIQKILGHSRLSTTDIYLDVPIDEALDEMRQKYNS